MRVLVIGGTGFIGSAAVAELLRRGNKVTVFHRGEHPVAGGAEILGNRRELAAFRERFRELAPGVKLDTILANGEQADLLMRTLRGIARRVVMLSSADVYRAVGIIHSTEPGEPDNCVITEDSPLRENLDPYPPDTVRILRSRFDWLEEDYDKIPVERVVLGDSELPGTVLRLPMVYGPGDPLHRLFPILKRIRDGRLTILLGRTASEWRGPRGYVENVAIAIADAVEQTASAGRIYNVTEPKSLTEFEWTRRVAAAAGWRGEIAVWPDDKAPAHLTPPGNYSQHWVIDSGRIRRELGFAERVGQDEALRRTISWELANPPAVDAAQFNYQAEHEALRG